MDNFLKRSFTAVFIVLFILGGFWLHPLTFVITGLVLAAGTQYEYYQLVKVSGVKPQFVAGLAAAVIIYCLSVLVAAGFIASEMLLLVIPVLGLLMIFELYRHQEKPFDSLAHTFFPLVYTTLPFSLFSFSAFGHDGLSSLLGNSGMVFSPGIVIGFLLLLWANDTGAYIVGVTIGRHRLMERISPKKSWEGFFGGMIISAAVAWLLSGFLGVVSTSGWIIISLIVSVTGTFGDLVESMFKRSLGVKDSGTIMPGHGGFLDRFDSAIMSFPAVYLYLTLFG
ncbi:MAG: phosphatidate cytidylyltransferase [Bacteroidales bacterium]